MESILTRPQLTLLHALIGKTGKLCSGKLWVGLNSAEDLFAQELEREGLVTRKEVPKQKLTLVTAGRLK